MNLDYLNSIAPEDGNFISRLLSGVYNNVMGQAANPIGPPVSARIRPQVGPPSILKSLSGSPEDGPSRNMVLQPYFQQDNSSPIDAGAYARAASPTGTYGFQEAASSPQETAETMQSIGGAPQESNWMDKINSIPSNPLFQIGLSLLDQKQSIGQAINSGFSNASKSRELQSTIGNRKALQSFDPSKYTNYSDAYKALVGAGADPELSIGLSSKLYGHKNGEYGTATPGSTIYDKSTGKVISQLPTKEVQVIQDLTTARDLQEPGSPEWNKYDAAIKGIGGGAKPTEYQSKSAMFGSRAQEADRILNDLEKSGTYSVTGQAVRSALSNTPGIGPLVGGVANSLTGVEGQKVDQAQRDFVNAILRAESGAVIGASEFDNARKQYFPQPGDNSETIAQKQRNRTTAISGLNNAAGSAKIEPLKSNTVKGLTQDQALNRLKATGKYP